MFFSIVTPVYNPIVNFLERAVASVQAQSYAKWEWVLVDDNSTEREGIEFLDNITSQSPRIHLLQNDTNLNISVTTNIAISHTSGSWIFFFDQDDLLHASALSEVFEGLSQNPQAKVVYTDEDKVDEDDKHFDPYYKPDWNPALLTSQNYFCHLLAVKRQHLIEIGKLRKGYEGSQDWDLCLRATSGLNSDEVLHIPKILYHWRAHPGSTAKSVGEKGQIVEDSSRRTLNDLISDRGLDAMIEKVDGIHWNIRRSLPTDPPSVAIVIVMYDPCSFDEKFLTELFEKTEYPGRIKVFLPENVEPSVHRGYSFWSSLSPINETLQEEVVCVLSTSVSPLEKSWLSELVAHASDLGVGICGPRLIEKKTGLLLSSGLVGDNDGIIKSIYEFSQSSFAGDKYRARLQQNLTFLHPACMVGRSSLFYQEVDFNNLSLVLELNLTVHLSGCRNLLVSGVDMATDCYTPINFRISESRKLIEWFEEVNYDPSFSPNLTIKSGVPITRAI